MLLITICSLLISFCMYRIGYICAETRIVRGLNMTPPYKNGEHDKKEGWWDAMESVLDLFK
jgi:hypothetical protein